MLAADIDDQAVDVDEGGGLDAGMAKNLTKHAPVAAADDQHPLRVAMGEQRNVREHFVVGEFVPFRRLHNAVQGEDAAENRRLEDREFLEFRPSFADDARDFEALGVSDRAAWVEALVKPCHGARPRRRSSTWIRLGEKARSRAGTAS